MHAYLERAHESLNEAAFGMNAAALRRRRPGKWSSAEILEHLARAFNSTAKLMGKHLASGHPATTRATFAQRLRVLTVITVGYFPNGTTAPEFTLPRGIAADEALNLFHEALAGMDEAITRCERRFGSGAKIAAHVLFGPLTANQWRKFHWLHSRHHAKQIAALRNLQDEEFLTCMYAKQ